MPTFSPHAYSGKLIAVCGTDGAGKSTLIDYLARRYVDRGFNVVLTKQPTSSARENPLFYDYIYKPERRSEIDYKAVLALMLSDRFQHQKEVIEPALKEGRIVISDRYIFTMIATMKARDHEEEWVYQACREIIKPDATIVAMANIHKAVERIRERESFEGSYVEKEHLSKTIQAFSWCVKEYDLNAIDTDRYDIDECCEQAIDIIDSKVQMR